MATLTQPPPALSPGEGTTWSGEVLRQLREARGITLQQLSERTKVTRHHIENIEGDRYDLLPASVYLRGILLSIARELRLDGQKVARSYLERVTAASAPAAPPPRVR
jgi:cytoskeletal protein RodZ